MLGGADDKSNTYTQTVATKQQDGNSNRIAGMLTLSDSGILRNAVKTIM